MSKTVEGIYVQGSKVSDWLKRLEDLMQQVQDLAAEMRQVEIVEINVRSGLEGEPKAKSAPKLKAKRQQRPAPTGQEILAAKRQLEAAAEPAKAEPVAAVARDVQPRPGPSRLRFGKFKEQLQVDHGVEVSNHMAEMCGNDRTVYALRRHVQRFIGTFETADQAAQAYLKVMGNEHGSELNTDDVLGELADVLHFDDGRTSLWCNEDEVGKMRRHQAAISHAAGGDDADTEQYSQAQAAN